MGSSLATGQFTDRKEGGQGSRHGKEEREEGGEKEHTCIRDREKGVRGWGNAGEAKLLGYMEKIVWEKNPGPGLECSELGIVYAR